MFTPTRPASAVSRLRIIHISHTPARAKSSPRLALLLLSHGLELLLPLLQLSQPLSQLHRLELSFVEGVERVPLPPPQLQNLKSEDKKQRAKDSRDLGHLDVNRLSC